MTDEPAKPATPGRKPNPDSERQKRLKAAREAGEKLRERMPELLPKSGTGRRPKLDPDQATLDQTVLQLAMLGQVHATLEESAGFLDVSSVTLLDFLERYPAARDVYEDAKAKGSVGLRMDQIKLAKTNGAVSIRLGEIMLGQRDPHKIYEIDRRLELEREKQQGAGRPIDVKSLTPTQLVQLLERIRAVKAQKAQAARDVTPAKP